MKTFEYKVRNFDIIERWSAKKQVEEVAKLEAELSALGAEGWELFGFHSFNMKGAVFGSDKGTATVSLWKRENTGGNDES